jgi:hypothetical protein
MSKAAHNKELIMRVLRLTDEQYMNLYLDQGMEYLRVYLADDETSRDILLAMPEYWSWWQRQWDNRNSRFAAEQHLDSWGPYVGKWERVLLRRVYDGLHDAARLEIRVSRRVMAKAVRVINASR